MLFDIIPNLLTQVFLTRLVPQKLTLLPLLHRAAITVFFPIFASYKALSSSDPAQLAPWLIYFLCQASCTLLESYLYILPWLPFYAWARLALYVWLLLPGESQGATFVYRSYIQPFFARHEAGIEGAISAAYERARAFGLDGLKTLVNHVRANVSDQSAATPPSPPAADASHPNYAQSLLSRFALPSARANFAASLAAPSSFLSAALQQAGGGPRGEVEQRAGAMPSLAALLEQVAALQQEKSDLTRQLQQERPGGGPHARPASSSQWSGMKSVGSESDFDTISHEDASTIKESPGVTWGTWMWGGGDKGKAGNLPASGGKTNQDVGSSSGVNLKY